MVFAAVVLKLVLTSIRLDRSDVFMPSVISKPWNTIVYKLCYFPLRVHTVFCKSYSLKM